jgi:hypothetical protein
LHRSWRTPLLAFDLTLNLSKSFYQGTPTAWAQDHLNAPVPEPSGLLLLSGGITGLAMTRRAKRE